MRTTAVVISQVWTRRGTSSQFIVVVHRWISSLQLQRLDRSNKIIDRIRALCLEFSYCGYRVTLLLIFDRLLVSGVLISTIDLDNSGQFSIVNYGSVVCG